ncbi:MAG: hypothetical protein ACM3SY_07165 [Candidatus Omnitrophota bacterium]
MNRIINKKKLIGNIYPTKHPVIYFQKDGLKNLEDLYRENILQSNIKGFITGYYTKMGDGFPYAPRLEITGFSLKKDEIDEAAKIIGYWSLNNREKVRLEFEKDKYNQYIWDSNNQEIQMVSSSQGTDNSFTQPFGYFILEEVYEESPQEIPESDVPQTNTQNEKLKINREDLFKSKNEKDEPNEKIKITITKDRVSSPSLKSCPFFDKSYIIQRSQLYEKHCGINSPKVNFNKEDLYWKIDRNRARNPSSPCFIFINKDIENKITHSSNIIGLLKGRKFTQVEKPKFIYLEIDGIIKDEPVENFYYWWEDRLRKIFNEAGQEKGEEMIGWFMCIGGENIQNIDSILQRVKEWHQQSVPGNHFVGIIKSEQRIMGNYVNIFSYNFNEKKEVKYDYNEVFSFLKVN